MLSESAVFGTIKAAYSLCQTEGEKAAVRWVGASICNDGRHALNDELIYILRHPEDKERVDKAKEKLQAYIKYRGVNWQHRKLIWRVFKKYGEQWFGFKCI